MGWERFRQPKKYNSIVVSTIGTVNGGCGVSILWVKLNTSVDKTTLPPFGFRLPKIGLSSLTRICCFAKGVTPAWCKRQYGVGHSTVAPLARKSWIGDKNKSFFKTRKISKSKRACFLSSKNKAVAVATEASPHFFCFSNAYDGFQAKITHISAVKMYSFSQWKRTPFGSENENIFAVEMCTISPWRCTHLCSENTYFVKVEMHADLQWERSYFAGKKLVCLRSNRWSASSCSLIVAWFNGHYKMQFRKIADRKALYWRRWTVKRTTEKSMKP